MGSVAEKLAPPYYAVLARPLDNGVGNTGLFALDALISEAPRTEGFLGLETGWLDDGTGAVICYWSTAEAVTGWKSRVLARLMGEVSLKHRRIEDTCAITVTRVAKRLFRRKTPLGVALVPGVDLSQGDIGLRAGQAA